MVKLSATNQYRSIPGARAPVEGAPARKRFPGLAAALLALAIAAPAAGQVPLTPARSDPNDPNAVLVEELVVMARERGPAFWRVENGQNVVYVLGVPSLAPKHMQWDQAGFMRRLEGANQVIVPAKGLRVRLAGVPGALFAYMRLKSGKPFEETLPPAEKARFQAARDKLGKPANRYGTRNPLAAGLLLMTDHRERWNLTDSDPSKLIRLFAEQHKVPIIDESYDLSPLLGAVARVSQAAGMPCLEEALAVVEDGPQPTLAATRAWAEGDVRGALAAERTYERCLAVAPGAAAFDQRVKADQAAAIARALQKPGHSIAVVQLRPLLAQGGVLDRLRAQGFTVKTPGEE